MAFSQDIRLKAEVIFAARKDEADFVPYEFVDHKGEFGLSSVSHLIHDSGTVHGFACRQNLAYEEIKAACHRRWNGSGKPSRLDSVTLGFIDICPVFVLLVP